VAEHVSPSEQIDVDQTESTASPSQEASEAESLEDKESPATEVHHWLLSEPGYAHNELRVNYAV